MSRICRMTQCRQERAADQAWEMRKCRLYICVFEEKLIPNQKCLKPMIVLDCIRSCESVIRKKQSGNWSRIIEGWIGVLRVCFYFACQIIMVCPPWNKFLLEHKIVASKEYLMFWANTSNLPCIDFFVFNIYGMGVTIIFIEEFFLDQHLVLW